MAAEDRAVGGKGQPEMLQAAVVLAVGAAAAAFVAGLGTYLYIRFTQNRRGPGEKEQDPPRP